MGRVLRMQHFILTSSERESLNVLQLGQRGYKGALVRGIAAGGAKTGVRWSSEKTGATPKRAVEACAPGGRGTGPRTRGGASSLWELAAALTSGAKDKGNRLPALRLLVQTLCPRGQFSPSESSIEAIPFFTGTVGKASALWVMGQKSHVRDLEQDLSGWFFRLRNDHKGSPS